MRALHDDGFWGPWSEDFILAVIPYLVYVEGGTFTMGSPESESYRDEDETQHEVSVSSFYIGKYEVTAREYYDVMGDRAGVYYRNGGPSSRFMGDDDDEYGNGNFPAFAGWYDAVEFCNALSRRDGLEPVYTITYGADGTSVESVEADWTAIGYRLPTEAEWEYAARGGRNSNGHLYAGSDDPRRRGLVLPIQRYIKRWWWFVFLCTRRYVSGVFQAIPHIRMKRAICRPTSWACTT